MLGAILKSEIEAFAAQQRTTNDLLRLAREGRMNQHIIRAYLCNSLYLVRQTLTHLALAQARATELGQIELAKYFETKVKEEQGHDRWAEDDIASIGGGHAIDARSQLVPSMKALVDYIYETIATYPASYLAYILFAEYFIVLLGPDWLSALQHESGIPPSSMTFVAKHVELDMHHAAEGAEVIDAIVRDPSAPKLLRKTLRRSMGYFDRYCKELSLLAA